MNEPTTIIQIPAGAGDPSADLKIKCSGTTVGGVNITRSPSHLH
jgi:hypothetical protein